MSEIWYLYCGVVIGVFITLPAETWNRHEAFALGIGITVMAYFASRGVIWIRFFYREVWEDDGVIVNTSQKASDQFKAEEPHQVVALGKSARKM